MTSCWNNLSVKLTLPYYSLYTIPYGVHGVHMEHSMHIPWTFHTFPCVFHSQTLYFIIFHTPFHMESMESTHSIWSPYGNYRGVLSTQEEEEGPLHPWFYTHYTQPAGPQHTAWCCSLQLPHDHILHCRAPGGVHSAKAGGLWKRQAHQAIGHQDQARQKWPRFDHFPHPQDQILPHPWGGPLLVEADRRHRFGGHPCVPFGAQRAPHGWTPVRLHPQRWQTLPPHQARVSLDSGSSSMKGRPWPMPGACHLHWGHSQRPAEEHPLWGDESKGPMGEWRFPHLSHEACPDPGPLHASHPRGPQELRQAHHAPATALGMAFPHRIHYGESSSCSYETWLTRFAWHVAGLLRATGITAHLGFSPTEKVPCWDEKPCSFHPLLHAHHLSDITLRLGTFNLHFPFCSSYPSHRVF